MVTKDEFTRFRAVKNSKLYDMHKQADDACWAADITAGAYTDILLNYKHYEELYA